MPKTIMKRNPKPSIYAELAKLLLKEHKIKHKGEIPSMRGGSKVIDFIEEKKGKKLDAKTKRVLAKMLNQQLRVLRAEHSSARQLGGSKFTDFFTKKIPNWWKSKPMKSFRSGFVQGLTGVSRVAEPILGAASLAFPALAPVAGGVSIFNQLAN